MAVVDPMKAANAPLKEVLAILLEAFTLKELTVYVNRGYVPNVRAFVKLIEPPALRNIILARLKSDYLKYLDQMTLQRYLEVIREYKPDFYPILIDQADPSKQIGRKWLLRSFSMIINFFKSL